MEETPSLLSMSLSDSVLSFFLDSPVSTNRKTKAEPVHDNQRRSIPRSLNAMQFPSGVALSRSRLLPHNSSSRSSFKSSRKRPRSLANHLGGFVLHSVTPRESSILQYTSIASPGTHTEYELVLEDSLASNAGERWVVSRRYSGFRSLRDELARAFSPVGDNENAHCSHCAPMVEALEKLSSKYFPKRRLWGSKCPKIVQQRAEQFFKYLQGLLALATNPSTRRCPLVALGFAVQLRTFFTLEREQFRTGAVPFLLNEMTLITARSDNVTTLMTIDEIDAVHADEKDCGLERLVFALASPVFLLEQHDELRPWDELENWEETRQAKL